MASVLSERVSRLAEGLDGSGFVSGDVPECPSVDAWSVVRAQRRNTINAP